MDREVRVERRAGQEDVRGLHRAERGLDLARDQDLVRDQMGREVLAERRECCLRANHRRRRGRDVQRGVAGISATRRPRKAR